MANVNIYRMYALGDISPEQAVRALQLQFPNLDAAWIEERIEMLRVDCRFAIPWTVGHGPDVAEWPAAPIPYEPPYRQVAATDEIRRRYTPRALLHRHKHLWRKNWGFDSAYPRHRQYLNELRQKLRWLDCQSDPITDEWRLPRLAQRP